jgi:hypothetical protein
MALLLPQLADVVCVSSGRQRVNANRLAQSIFSNLKEIEVFHRFRARQVLPIFVASVFAAALAASPAGAASSQTVRCVGTADFCGATVSIAGGASNRVVTINLTDTNFKRVGIRVIPSSSRGAFSISKASFRLGGSQYRFTLNAVRANPPRARIILLFAAGTAA